MFCVMSPSSFPGITNWIEDRHSTELDDSWMASDLGAKPAEETSFYRHENGANA